MLSTSFCFVFVGCMFCFGLRVCWTVNVVVGLVELVFYVSLVVVCFGGWVFLWFVFVGIVAWCCLVVGFSDGLG